MKQFENLKNLLAASTISKSKASLKSSMRRGMTKVILFFFVICVLASCSPRLYFTVEQRNLVEHNSLSLTSLQYYVDKDVVLKREVSSQEATTLRSGEVKVESGKYIHIITLRKNTPGVCTRVVDSRRLNISFEMGDGKYLTFGVSQSAKLSDIYEIFANEWKNNIGKIIYDGKEYYIQTNATGGSVKAQLMFKKLTKDQLKVEKNTMKGRKVTDTN